jgi:stage II sporulation protein D
MRFHLLICALLAGAGLLPARGDDSVTAPVKVRLCTFGAPSRLTILPAGDVRILDGTTNEPLEATARPLLLTAKGSEVWIGTEHRPSVRLEAEQLEIQSGRVRRSYPGALLISASRGTLCVMNECSLESYTEGVLVGECPAAFHPEAIKAMAVAVRSYCFRKAFIARGELCDSTHCQVYRGVGGVPASIRAAVQATAGQCALYDGQVIDAVYCSDCGGYTEANEEAWKGARPVEDAPEPEGTPYCAVNRSHTWRLTLPLPRLKSLLGRAEPPKAEASLEVQILDTTESGRVRRLSLLPKSGGPEGGEAADTAGTAGSRPRLFSGEELRRLLGLSVLKSLKFEARVTAQGIELQGSGWGHGVGLCQFGANGMARQGIPYSEILKHYYTGIVLAPAPPVDEARPRPPTRTVRAKVSTMRQP